jgi:hypothetical protein
MMADKSINSISCLSASDPDCALCKLFLIKSDAVVTEALRLLKI